METNSRDESINLIKLSLQDVYYNTILSNPGQIRFNSFVLVFSPGLYNEFYH
jgi:hypothetical protein